MEHCCPLCSERGNFFYKWKERVFFRCSNCKGIFVHQKQLPDPKSEEERYLLHNNNALDENFQRFVSPITEGIKERYSPLHSGLDFGSGPGSAVSRVLSDHSYTIRQYDPFFANDTGALKEQYDYIACCEVIEHFHKPAKEFRLLKSLLKSTGALYCMTNLYTEETRFESWYYKNDFTHVFFYCPETIRWIKEAFNFGDFIIKEKLIIFYNYQL